MCGIAGILHFGRSATPVNIETLQRMRTSMAHRGPDGEGMWVAPDNRVGLVHRRLAIIDLSAEAGQPMSSGDGQLQLVFNGMIYNHRELRRELETLGERQWRTDHSDTEVILHAWQRWGIDCVHRLRGMFAFAIWDNRQRALWLVRDRFGIKPLYYAVDQQGLSFASEIQTLLAGNPALRTMNPLALARFLHFGYIPGEETSFKGIQRLMPGCWMRIEPDGTETVSRYWEALDHTRSVDSRSEESCAEEVLALLTQAVEEHNLSDVPLGLLLSGGVDSSAIASLSVAAAGSPLPSFTVGYDGSHPSCPDETGYARAAAAMAGTQYYQKILSAEEFEAGVQPLVAAMAEPCSVYHLPLSAVVERAGEHGVRVLQGGEGADEIFLGYPLFLKALAHEERRSLSPFNAIIRQLGSHFMLSPSAKLTPTLPSFYGNLEGLNLRRLGKVLGSEMSSALQETPLLSVVGKLYKEFMERTEDPSTQQWLGYVELHMRLSSSLLPKLDIITMQHGIECRVPFLDHRLVECAFSIPGTYRMDKGKGKIILKDAVRNLVPPQVVDRPKQGLFAPYVEWFHAGMGERMQQKVLGFASETGLLKKKEVSAIFSKNPNRAWPLYSFTLWHQHFFDS